MSLTCYLTGLLTFTYWRKSFSSPTNILFHMQLWFTFPTHILHPEVCTRNFVPFFIKATTFQEDDDEFDTESGGGGGTYFWMYKCNWYPMMTSVVYCLWNKVLLLYSWLRKCYSTHLLASMKIRSSLLKRFLQGHLLSESLLRWSSVDGRPCLSSPRSEREILSLQGESLYSWRHKKDKDRWSQTCS